MKSTTRILLLSFVALLVLSAVAFAAPIVLKKGTPVTLVFDQALSSKTAQEGQHVKMHVLNNVSVGNHLAIKAGTPVSGLINQVEKRKRYGVNAKLRLTLNPVKSVMGPSVPLEPQSEGKQLKGSKTDKAAGATVGGAAILGPIGLAGGLFVHGKNVEIRVGDKLQTEVSSDVVLKK